MIGWYVRVTTVDVGDGVYNTVLYVVRLPTPAEAEEAVQQARSNRSKRYEVLLGEVTAERGPQPMPGEVRLLVGAV